MGIWKYFEDRQREIRECSMYVPDGITIFAAEQDEQRGKVYGPVLFDGYPPSVFLGVTEDVVAKDSGFTRPRYAYFLVIDRVEIGGYERHPTHHPAVHRHCSKNNPHESQPAKVVSFKEAAAEAWKYVSEFATPLGQGEM